MFSKKMDCKEVCPFSNMVTFLEIVVNTVDPKVFELKPHLKKNQFI